ncbi:MAG: beta-ketoacyl synthase N-terminal-like domain-containing protein [Myxococcota bacterium]
MERSGIRFIEPEEIGHDPSKLEAMATVYLERDLTFQVASKAEAQAFHSAAPDTTRVSWDAEEDSWSVTRLAGSVIRVPRTLNIHRDVAGMIPSGFDFTRFGIPPDMVENVDRLTLFNIVATVDAWLSAGMTPEELLSRVHPARIGNVQGAGIGGMRSLERLYVDPVLDRERQGDVLQETLINVLAAYVVQSYVGSYGPMSHPVGACATSLLSLELGLDTIRAGKAEFVVAGGYDDIGPAGQVGFSDMNATADTTRMQAMGLEPDQMSRPNDIRRRGFVEGQGGGTLLLARADVALELGLPIQGVLAWASSFGDGIHTSIPAPGVGLLAAAMGRSQSPLAQALERFGLTADDIALVYKHDTSTAANDPNENNVHDRIQHAIGRTQGNPLWAVSQKALTGHSKGGAAAFQAIGLCQALQHGIIPGNPNLDNVDPDMERFAHIGFTDQPLHADAQPLRAGLVTSLGFGHVSGIALVLHPDAFAAMLTPEQRATWQATAQERVHRGRHDWASVRMGRATAFHKRTDRRLGAPDGSDVALEREAAMLLDPDARFDLFTQRFTTKPS